MARARDEDGYRRQTVTVRPRETVVSIARNRNIPEEDLLDANPGVVTVRPGQVINVPPPSFSGNMNNNGGPRTTGGAHGVGIASPLSQIYNIMSNFVPSFNASNGVGGNRRLREEVPPKTGGGYMPSLVPVNRNPFAGGGAGAGGMTAEQARQMNFQTPATTGFRTPSQGINPLFSPQNMTSAGRTPTPAPVSPYAGYTGTAGYWAQGGTPMQYNFQTPPTNGFQAQPAPYLGASSYLNPALRPQQTPSTPRADQIPPRPSGMYTGDPNDPNTAAWQARWNWEARNPVRAREEAIRLGLYTGPRVMTRDEIWNIKAEQRRRGMEAAEEDGTIDYGGGGWAGEGQPMNNVPLVRSITWGI